MQALRHASRRALHASVVMQETFAASVKAYSSEATSPVAARKTKEERVELVKQFVAKFKAANNGQLPGITLLRKEVGGKYDTLKEVLQELAKGQDEPDTPKQTVDRKDAEAKTQEFAAATKDGIKEELPLKEDSEKDKKEMPQISKKAVKSVDPAHSRKTSKDIQSVVPGKDASKLVMDTCLITDEDEDDSDVAAPKYYRSPLMQMAHHKMEEGVKVAKGKEKVLENGLAAHLKNGVIKKQNDSQAMNSKHPDIKHPEVQDGGIRVDLPHKAQDADDTAAKNLPTYGSVGFWGKSLGPLTTVARIVNLPQHITASKLKEICETVAKVHEVDFRRRHIADVYFNVDLQEMGGILDRLKRMSIGSTKLRVISAYRFSNANNKFKPQDVNHYRHVRNILLVSLEQRFQFLSWQIQDYRELQELKLAR